MGGKNSTKCWTSKNSRNFHSLKNLFLPQISIILLQWWEHCWQQDSLLSYKTGFRRNYKVNVINLISKLFKSWHWNLLVQSSRSIVSTLSSKSCYPVFARSQISSCKFSSMSSSLHSSTLTTTSSNLNLDWSCLISSPSFRLSLYSKGLDCA